MTLISHRKASICSVLFFLSLARALRLVILGLHQVDMLVARYHASLLPLRLAPIRGPLIVALGDLDLSRVLLGLRAIVVKLVH